MSLTAPLLRLAIRASILRVQIMTIRFRSAFGAMTAALFAQQFSSVLFQFAASAVSAHWAFAPASVAWVFAFAPHSAVPQTEHTPAFVGFLQLRQSRQIGVEGYLASTSAAKSWSACICAGL